MPKVRLCNKIMSVPVVIAVLEVKINMILSKRLIVGSVLPDVLAYCWRFPWFSKPGWIPHCMLCCLSTMDSPDSPLLRHLLTPWQSVLQLSLFDPHTFSSTGETQTRDRVLTTPLRLLDEVKFWEVVFVLVFRLDISNFIPSKYRNLNIVCRYSMPEAMSRQNVTSFG